MCRFDPLMSTTMGSTTLGMHDNGVKKVTSPRSQFWMMYASIGEDDSCATGNFFRHELTDSVVPTNVELIGFANSYIPKSSCHYGGSLPLTAQSQENHVLIRSSNCWRTAGLIIPAQNPSFQKLHRVLQSHYVKTVQFDIERKGT